MAGLSGWNQYLSYGCAHTETGAYGWRGYTLGVLGQAVDPARSRD